jgi:hypothetical protein
MFVCWRTKCPDITIEIIRDLFCYTETPLLYWVFGPSGLGVFAMVLAVLPTLKHAA